MEEERAMTNNDDGSSRGPLLRVRSESIRNGRDKKIPTVLCLPHRPGAVNHLTQPDDDGPDLIRVMSLAWARLKSMSSSGLGIPKSCRNIAGLKWTGGEARYRSSHVDVGRAEYLMIDRKNKRS